LDVLSGLRAHYALRRPGWRLLDHAGNLHERVVYLRAVASRQRRREANTATGDSTLAKSFESTNPRVSVVIHVPDGRPLPKRCIESRAMHPSRHGIEVILVVENGAADDNGSERSHAGVRVLRNATPLGFARSSNRAARCAVGEYILFLGSDSLALPGCIDHLVDTMDEDATVGVSAAKITDRAGRLRAAGGLIWKDGSRWSLGQGSGHLSPQYNFRRSVDVGSASALMVRRELLAAVGFLDEHMPSADVDADLCLAAGARGYRVMYEPGAEVLDFGGDASRRRPSATRDVRFGVPDAGTHSRFADKWDSTLRDHFGQPRRQSLRAELRGSSYDPRPRVLVCDWTVPMPDRDSGGQRMDWILRLLSPMCAGITLVPSRRFAFQDNQMALQRSGVEVLAGDGRQLSRLLVSRAGLYDLVILSRAHVAEQHLSTVRRLQPQARVVFDTVELKSLRLDQQLRTTGVARDGSIPRERALEDRLIRASDAVATVSEEEGAEVRRRLPQAQTLVLPNVHEVGRDAVASFPSRRDLIFVGNFTHPPNVDAVQWFSVQVMPLIRAEIDVVLRVVGPGATPKMTSQWGPFTRYEGWVPDVTRLYSESRVAVAPLRYGAGVKGKIGQALSLGLPVVTTSAGADGMNLVDGTHALIADEPQSFAKAVVRVYENAAEWKRLSDAGLAIAAERWSPEAMSLRLEKLLRTTVERQALGMHTPLQPIAIEGTAMREGVGVL
jgi:GT2 family glycosyltransferase/glycosyltransferase involved in cell wall biosynthesis